MKRSIAILGICALSALLCGCSWRDAGDLSAVTAAAIEQNTDDDNYDDNYTVTAELAVPSADSAMPDSQTITQTMDTLAIESVGDGRDAQLYWSHARVFILDNSVQNIDEILSVLTASSAVRPSVRICIAKDSSAQALLTQTSSLSGDPVGFALGDSLDLAVEQCRAPSMPLYRALDRVRSSGIDAALPAITAHDGQAVVDGCALLRNGIVCGWLEAEQTTALCIAQARGTQAVVQDAAARFTLSDISSSIEEHSLCITANVTASDSGAARRAAAALRQQCREMIEILQRTGCDALGFGRWTDGDWTEQEITVSVTLRAVPDTEGGDYAEA